MTGEVPRLYWFCVRVSDTCCLLAGMVQGAGTPGMCPGADGGTLATGRQSRALGVRVKEGLAAI
jgi:hypothetical protein